jgi:hypothetical protein
MNFIFKCSKNFSYWPSVVLNLLHHTHHFLSLINISENHHKIRLQITVHAKCPPSLHLRAARLTEHRRAAGQVVSQHFHRLVFHSSSHYCPPPSPPTARDPLPPSSLCLSLGRLSPSLPSSHLPSPPFYSTMFTNRRNFCRIIEKGSLYKSRPNSNSGKFSGVREGLSPNF